MAEIRSEEELRAWLEGKPVDYAQVLAVRVAMRVLPFIKPSKASMLLFVFRAYLISWTAKRWSVRNLIYAAAKVGDALRLHPRYDIDTVPLAAAAAIDAITYPEDSAYVVNAAVRAAPILLMPMSLTSGKMRKMMQPGLRFR